MGALQEFLEVWASLKVCDPRGLMGPHPQGSCLVMSSAAASVNSHDSRTRWLHLSAVLRALRVTGDGVGLRVLRAARLSCSRQAGATDPTLELSPPAPPGTCRLNASDGGRPPLQEDVPSDQDTQTESPWPL